MSTQILETTEFKSLVRSFIVTEEDRIPSTYSGDSYYTNSGDSYYTNSGDSYSTYGGDSGFISPSAVKSGGSGSGRQARKRRKANQKKKPVNQPK